MTATLPVEGLANGRDRVEYSVAQADSSSGYRTRVEHRSGEQLPVAYAAAELASDVLEPS